MSKKKHVDKSRFAYYFIAPYFITFLIFGVYPILYSFYLSFTKWNGMTAKPEFVNIQNYITLFHDKFFFKSISNTLIMWGLNIIPQIIFALILAVILTDEKLKGRDIFRGLYYLPNLVTMSSVAVLFSFILDWKTGALNKILVNMHIISQPVNWLQNITATRSAVAFINWWMWFGYSMIIFMAGIKSISNDVFEAARVDGASKWQTFSKVTLPLIRPTMIYTVITSLIGGLTMFDVPFVLTNGDGSPQGSITTMVIYLYNTAFKNYNYGYGATVGVGLFCLTLVSVVAAYKFLNKNPIYE